MDSTLAYYFDDRPLLSLDDGQASLPAHEKLWHASSGDAWKQIWQDSNGMYSLPPIKVYASDSVSKRIPV